MMKKVMHPLSVDTNSDGDIVLSQRIDDPNYPDPEILISPDQVPLLMAWIYEARDSEASELESEPVAVNLYGRGPRPDLEKVSVYNNPHGMIILKIDDDTFIEISPAMAKRLREQLSVAIRAALTEMLRPDAEA
jgi:hypothetical protein